MKGDYREPSLTYSKALRTFKEASVKFRDAETLYRQRVTGDAEYLEQRRIFAKANLAFDVAEFNENEERQ